MKIYDLTHKFDNSMPVYPGDPVPTFTQTAHLEKDGYNEFCFCGGMHVGTHMDAPLHMIHDGDRICDIPISRFFGRGRLVDARGKDSISADLLSNVELNAGDVVLVFTGWSEKFRSDEYYGAFPAVEIEFANALVSAGVSILALDTPSPDRPPFPVHKILLGNDTLIIENSTNIKDLIGLQSFDVVALPSKFDCEGAPVRLVARG